MHNLNFKYNGQEYSVNMSAQTLENKSTGKVLSIELLRDHGLIIAVNKCVSNAESQRVYEMITEGMINSLGKLKM